LILVGGVLANIERTRFRSVAVEVPSWMVSRPEAAST
jgi:hypothetical protein